MGPIFGQRAGIGNWSPSRRENSSLLGRESAVSKLVSRKPFPKTYGPTVVGPPSWPRTARFSFKGFPGILLEKGVADGKEEKTEGGLDLCS